MSEVIHVIRAAGNPTAAPQRAGQHWVNTTDKRTFFSVGNATVNDWIEDDLYGHLAAADPHPQYETSAEAQAKVDAHANLTNNPHNVTKAQVGLGNVDNTSDVNKPVSTAQQAALDTKISSSLIGVANGVTPTGPDNKVPAAFLPSYVDDVLEYANLAAFPVTGETGKIYIAIDTGLQYRWSGSMYAPIAASPGTTDNVPEGSLNLYFTTARVLTTLLSGLSLATGGTIANTDSVLVAFGKLQKQITDNLATLTAHIGNTSNPHAVTKTQVGLSNVQNVDTTTTTNINEGTNLFFTETRVRATVLTGLSLAVYTAVVATDTILEAIGKLQAQFNLRQKFITTVVQTISTATPTSITELTTPSLAVGTYRFSFTGVFQSTANTVGIGLRIGAGTAVMGAANGPWEISQNSAGNSQKYMYDQVSPTTDLSSPSVDAANSDFSAKGEGLFTVTTAGTVALQLRSETGAAVSIRPLSVLVVEKIA